MNSSEYYSDNTGYCDSGEEDLDGEDNDLIYAQAGRLKTVKLNTDTKYQASWTGLEAFRELYQNWYVINLPIMCSAYPL